VLSWISQGQLHFAGFIWISYLPAYSSAGSQKFNFTRFQLDQPRLPSAGSANINERAREKKCALDLSLNSWQ